MWVTSRTIEWPRPCAGLFVCWAYFTGKWALLGQLRFRVVGYFEIEGAAGMTSEGGKWIIGHRDGVSGCSLPCCSYFLLRFIRGGCLFSQLPCTGF